MSTKTKYNLQLPRMGESVDEATIVSWLKEVGDEINVDDFVVEIATDKVDSEVPSDVKGKLIEKCFEVNDVVKVGETIVGEKKLSLSFDLNQKLDTWMLEEITLGDN